MSSSKRCTENLTSDETDSPEFQGRNDRSGTSARPKPRSRQLLIQTSASLVSAGTERMLVDFGKANWLNKARQQPDKVRMVLDKARTDGVLATYEAVQSKLDQPLAPGYCNVGVVSDLGSGASGFSVGDRVASNGPHAELVCVPHTLCARVPENVTDDQASFTVLGAIGLQGIRLASPSLGECVVVTGLGLIGLMTVQLLRAQGCRVMGIDPDPVRRSLAERFGAEMVVDPLGADVVAAGIAFSRSRGVDAVADHGSHEKQRAGQPGGADVSQARAHRARRGHRPGAVTRGFLRKGTELSGQLLVRARTLRSGLRGRRSGLSSRIRALDRTAQLRGRSGHAGQWRAGCSAADQSPLQT